MSKDYIYLEESSCQHCMRCVRICPTNAMTYLQNKPQIVNDDCILCGKCYAVCPHEAKSVKSDLRKVTKWLEDGEEVVLSIAPSFATVWPELDSLCEILKMRGFKHVEETAQGASLVSKAYANLVDQHEMNNIITTCCPVVTTLVEKYYGDLCKYLAPVVSPMIAHGMMLKEKYPGCKVVFLSPCIAKFKEMEDDRFKDNVDAMITMEDLLDWIETDLQLEEVSKWKNFVGSIARLYPIPGGILRTLESSDHYKYASIEGIDRIKQMLDAMRDGTLNGYFFEASACTGSCIGGPLLTHFKHNEWLGQSIIFDNINLQQKIQKGPLPFDLSTTWHEQSIYQPRHSEEEIKQCLIDMGKTSQEKIHDCGACGYETCRAKAIAVLDGKADPRICLPNALEQAESLSSIILNHTPNGIILLDNDLMIQEMNQSARKMLDYEMVNPTGLPLSSVLYDDALLRLIKGTSEEQSEFIRIYYKDRKKLIDHAIVNVRKENYYILILMDRTREFYRDQQMKEMREQTMAVTQQVIDEQMTTVQEIASILGETTARSKVALTRLKMAMEELDE